MILVGEIEFTEKSMYPDGYAGHLFVGMSRSKTDNSDISYHYSIAPVGYKNSYHVGDNFTTKQNLSVTEFLQMIVDMDIQIGRGVVQKFPETAKVRLKGMTEWIERKPVTKIEDHEIRN